MHKSSYYIVNAITLYRMIAVVALLYFIITKQAEIFKWFLAISFFTDAVDGFLAGKFKVTGASKWQTDVKGLYWVVHSKRLQNPAP